MRANVTLTILDEWGENGVVVIEKKVSDSLKHTQV